MKRNLILGAFAIVACVSAVLFIKPALAEGGKDRSAKTVMAPSASTTLVLSQVDGGGGGSTGTYLNDYVEIKNISGTTQSLNGLSVYYGSAVGNFASSATNAFALPNVSLNPGQYYLVQLGAAGTAGAALPVTPDATTTNLSMSATNGKVALVVTAALGLNACGATATPCNSTQLAAIVDWVAWGAAGNGTAGNGEGGTAVNAGVALTSAQGAVRKTNGCTDTDNNNADFDVVTAPVPRNSATTPAPCGATSHTQHYIDFDGDGKTDFSVVRNTGGGPTGQITWYTSINGTGTVQFTDWGINGDFFVPADYDGDGKTDIAIWRSGAPGSAGYYILQSQTNTVRFDSFGQTGDDPTVIGDYTGDGKADPAVYRGGANSGDQSYWYYRASSGTFQNQIVYEQWGQNGDFPAPGDFDGDGKSDFMVQRNAGGGQAIFWLRTNTTNSVSNYIFGTPTDVIVPGDYDGDGKTDIATVRGSGGSLVWFYRASSTGNLVYLGSFGTSATDFMAQGDYDGDGKTDIAVWRPSATPGASFFYVNGTTSGFTAFQWGSNGDYPIARYNGH